ncbi:hydrolase [Altericroceibacterium spongiae]|uniref:Hydrolase n=1 Tax=Altericroceibacterium spongiae TaxID=2320269 RepID=A0A420ER89_9SPHN|nr:hydrolase [Altericroceibacterium spongiae]RKF23170.1 hydrolase [Altericroceibacterium spongiae]
MKKLNTQEQALIEPIDSSEMLAQVQRWSAINSGTGNLEGLARQAEELAAAFDDLPGSLRFIDPAPVTAIDADGHEFEKPHGHHLVLNVRPEVSRRVLLTGHMDTVFPADHSFQDQRWLDEDTLNGPGVADMKGGIAVIIAALKAFETSEVAASLGYDVMINSDEETGSLASSDLIAELAQGNHAALTYEPSALPDGTLAHARGGSGNYSLIVTGRSAHAGRNPQDGRNAIVAAAALALSLKEMQSDAIAINPARIEGGSANNVVPDHAVLRFNIRPKTSDVASSFPNNLKALIESVSKEHDVAIKCHGGISRPPKPVDQRTAQLFNLVKDTAAGLGQDLGWRDTGGVCDGNNIAACGVPVVDTMGVRGGSIHSSDEFLIVSSLAERASLSALVLHRLAIGALV